MTASGIAPTALQSKAHVPQGAPRTGQVERACEVCGGRARVRILRDYEEGQPLIGDYCLICADSAAQRHVLSLGDGGATRDGLANASLFLGLALGLLAVLSDYLNIQGQPGFGWHQQLGLLVGGILVTLAAILRVDALGILGMMVLVLSIFADLLGIGRSSGFGWKQEGVAIVALALIWLGWHIRRRSRKLEAGAIGANKRQLA